MTVDLKTFLIACPLVFLGGFIDSIAGGGGLITMPAYLLAGLPPHLALGTNKLSSMMGNSASVYRVVKNRMLKPRLAVPGIIAALLGSTLGSRLVLLVSDEILKYVMVVVLPFVAILVLNKKIFKDIGADEEIISVKTIMATKGRTTTITYFSISSLTKSTSLEPRVEPRRAAIIPGTASLGFSILFFTTR